MTNLTELLALLKAHDVYYQHSDDPSAFRRGQLERSALVAASWETAENRKLFLAFFENLGETK